MQVRRGASFVAQTPIPDIGSGSERRLLPGWVIGGGIEYAFGGNWSAKVEYLYAHFAESTLGYSLDFAGNNSPNAVRVREQLSLQMARFGLNYHFGDARSATSLAFYTKAAQALAYTWSGIYVGAHAGWARTRADFDADVFPGVFIAPPISRSSAQPKPGASVATVSQAADKSVPTLNSTESSSVLRPTFPTAVPRRRRSRAPVPSPPPQARSLRPLPQRSTGWLPCAPGSASPSTARWFT